MLSSDHERFQKMRVHAIWIRHLIHTFLYFSSTELCDALHAALPIEY
jgi:hypothetical protein